MTSMIVSAQQIQHGYVKTRGKLIDGKVIAGKRVPNVAITIDGVNTIISSKTGEFSFPIRKESFSIRSVHKSGYSLVDNNILNQEFSYSSSPLIIVVEENTELTQEKVRINRQIRLSLQRKLEEKENSLEELRNHNKITIGEYNSLLKELYEEQTRNEGVIGNIVDYSMGIDYDSLDEFNAQIQEYLHAGNLSKADSIIHTIDLSKRVLQLNKMRLELQENVSQMESAKNKLLMSKKTLAEELKIKSQLYIQENELDAALKCLDYRISIDSTAYDYYLDKAILIRDKFPDRVHESELLFTESIRCAKEKHDKYVSSIEYGAYCQQVGEFDKAILQYSDALNLIETEDSISKTNVLAKLGIACNSMRNYEEALSYYQQALSYVTSTQIDYQKRSAELYNNIGVVYENLNKYGRALDANYKALQIRQGLYVNDPDNPDIAMSYSNIASVYDNIEAWEQAVKYYKMAIELFAKNKKYHELAYAYNNIASTYYNAENLSMALKNSVIAFMEINKYYPNHHPTSLTIQNNLLTIESEIQSSKMNLNLDQDGLIITCRNLAYIYSQLGEFSNAEKYYEITLNKYEQLFAEDSDVYREGLASTQNSYGALCRIIKKYKKSEEQIKLAFDNYKILYEQNPNTYRTDLAWTYRNFMFLYADMNEMVNYDKYLDLSLEFYLELYSSEPRPYINDVIQLQNRKVWRLLVNMKNNEALDLAIATYAKDKTNDTSRQYLAECYNSKAYEYAIASDYNNAHISIDMAISLLPDNANFYDSKGEILLMQGKNDEALEMWKKVLKLNPNFLDDYPDGTNLSNGLKKLGLIE